MTVEEVIREARDYHETFTPEAHPDGVCLRAVARMEERFYHVVMKEDEHVLAQDHTFDAAAITGAITGSTLSLPSTPAKIIQAVVAHNDAIFPVGVNSLETAKSGLEFQVRVVGRDLYLEWPTAFQTEMEASLRENLQEASPWKEADALRITYVPHPTAPTAPGDSLTLPDEAKRFLVGGLAEFLATRRAIIGPDRGDVLAQARTDKAQVMEAFLGRGANEVDWYVT